MSYNLQVLIVDDVRTERMIIRSLLRMAGVHSSMIFFADCGVRALDMLSINSDSVDIVFMDIHMPLLDGVTATCVIRKSFPSLKVVGVSSDDPGDTDISVFDAYVQKPFSKDKFAKVLERLFPIGKNAKRVDENLFLVRSVFNEVLNNLFPGRTPSLDMDQEFGEFDSS